jgi:hypothetical protein
VEMKVRMHGQPLAHRRMVVGSFHSCRRSMQLPARIATGQRIDEFDELLVAMAADSSVPALCHWPPPARQTDSCYRDDDSRGSSGQECRAAVAAVRFSA